MEIYSGVFDPMLRGYRFFIAAAGLASLFAAAGSGFYLGALCCAKSPPEQAQSSSSGRQQASPTPQLALTPAPAAINAPVVKFTAYPGYDPDPCYHAEDHDAADLCAQWRASIAAEKTTKEARRATTWSIVATILSVVTVMGLIVSLHQTSGALTEARRGNRLNMAFERRARRESGRAAKDQERALQIAESQLLLSEKSNKAQIRSYLTVARMEPFQTTGGDQLSVKVFIKNVGQTPARIKYVAGMAWMTDQQTISPIEDGPPATTYYHFIDVLPQGSEDEILVICDDCSLIEKLNGTDKADIFVYGRIEFTDIFGDDHWMTFASCPVNWGFTRSTEFRPCVDGNNSD